MKAASPALAAHLAQTASTLATCWRLTREDGTEYGFTNHDRDLVLADGVTYKAATGFTPSSINSSDQLNVDNLEVQGFLDDVSIQEDELAAGLFDYADVSIRIVNWSALEQGDIILRSGTLGEVKRSRGQFYAEMRGLAQALQQIIGEVLSPTCLANLGDARCKVDLAPHSVIGTVSATVDARTFVDATLGAVEGRFDYGLLTFTGGANNGFSMEVKRQDGAGTIALFHRLPYRIAAGDTYTVHTGCDKLPTTCRDVFDNIVNIRAHPYVTGESSLLRFGGQ